VWFVRDGEKLYLVPVRGFGQRLVQEPPEDADDPPRRRGSAAQRNRDPTSDAAKVEQILDKFRAKYGARGCAPLLRAGTVVYRNDARATFRRIGPAALASAGNRRRVRSSIDGFKDARVVNEAPAQAAERDEPPDIWRAARNAQSVPP
jgi:hypothetical protein